MSILERIQRIARANLNWLLDRADPPEQQLAEHIAELQSALAEGRQCAANYGATVKRMTRQADELGQRIAALQARAEAALAAGDEPAARAALGEKLQSSERLAGLEPGLAQGRANYEQLKDNLAALGDQLSAARLRLEELRARQRAAEAHRAFAQRLDGAGAPGADADAFDRLEDGVLQAEAEVEAREEIRAASMGEADLDARSRQWQVEAELAALKQRIDRPKESDHGTAP